MFGGDRTRLMGHDQAGLGKEDRRHRICIYMYLLYLLYLHQLN